LEGLCGGLGDPALCGNGLLDVGEACDDGNLDQGDACTPECQEPICGDSFIAPGEACDDGNTANGDTCTATCQLPVPPPACGNGDVEAGEECDDGNEDENDACTPMCRLPVCQDGFLTLGEECDDGNNIGTDACTPTCTLPVCGDGFNNSDDEACDDGNDIETDECLTNCRLSPASPTLELTLTQVRQFEFTWESVPGAEWYELYKRVDGQDEYVQVTGMLVGNSYSMTIPLLNWVKTSYQLRACNVFRCAESIEAEVEENLANAVGIFKASNTGVGDEFGTSVALSADGKTLVVGAPKESSYPHGVNEEYQDDNSQPAAGAVYVFTIKNDTWTQQAFLKSHTSTSDDNEHFGHTVALSADGNTLAVGESGYGCKGRVHVFVRVGESWAQHGFFTPSENCTDLFGSSLAISDDGNTLAAGAPGDDGPSNLNTNRGLVYLFTRENDTWMQQTTLTALNANDYDLFGSAVALSGDGKSLAVSAIGEDGNGSDSDDNNVPKSGAVYVFERENDTWIPNHYLKASTPGEEDIFGYSIALSEDGSSLAVGAPYESGAGAAYLFSREDNTWAQDAYVKASNPGVSDGFGSSVALSGDGATLVVGAIGESSHAKGLNGDEENDSSDFSGAAYMFTLGDTWTQETYIKASSPRGGDNFGGVVALSADASTLAVGAARDNSSTTGVGNEPNSGVAFNTGAVYLY